MHRGLALVSLACMMAASAYAVDEVLAKLLFPGKHGHSVAIPESVIGDSLGSKAELAKSIKNWCQATGLCADFTSAEAHRTKRAATPVRDLCKFYGVKCKRGAPMASGEDALYEYVIDSFLEHCSNTDQCDFHRYLDDLNNEVRSMA